MTIIYIIIESPLVQNPLCIYYFFKERLPQNQNGYDNCPDIFIVTMFIVQCVHKYILYLPP